MFVVGSDQMATLDSVAEREFETRLTGYVRERIPAATATMPPGQLQAEVAEHAAAARGFGIQTQSGIAQFVCLCFMPGPLFYQNAPMRTFLTMPGPDPDTKIRYVAERIAEELEKALGKS